MHQLNILAILVLCTMIFSCAKQTAPTGGPKDTIPPTLANSFPAKEALNVNQQQITLDFDEHIILANPKEQIIITPDVNKKYKVTARKKRMILDLEDPLQPNTTYTINFRDAVQDITEKNPARNLKLAFSTGTYIDSLSIQGNIKDLITDQYTKDATVALYDSDTFDIFKHKPQFFTKSDEKGNFLIENLRNDTFYIYAFQDKNRNLIVDSKSESYGFRAEPLILHENHQQVHINLIRLDARPLKLTSARPSNTYFNIRFTKGLEDFETLPIDADTISSTFGEDRANIRVYNTFPYKDSTQIRLLAKDSIGNAIDTTVYVKFQTRQVTPETFTFSQEQTKLTGRNGVLLSKGKFNKPLRQLNYDSIRFRIDSTTVLAFNPEDILYKNKTGELIIRKQIDRKHFTNPAENRPRELTPEPPPKQDPDAYTLILGQGALLSIENDSSTTLSQKTKPLSLDDTGMIIAAIKTENENFIIQLVDKSLNVISSVTNKNQATFHDLLPGDYLLRVVHDRNADGTWTPGNFYNSEEPEPIFYYMNEKKIPIITLKANFELGPLLITF